MAKVMVPVKSPVAMKPDVIEGPKAMERAATLSLAREGETRGGGPSRAGG